MNLLIFNWQDRQNPQAGGAELHLHEIFGRLARRGHLVTLVAAGWGDAPEWDGLDGIEVRRTGGRHRYFLSAAPYYRRHLASEPFDIVIEDLNKVPLFTPLWIRQPLVLIVHHLFGATAFQEASLPIAAATWALERPIGPVYRDVPVQAVSQSTADDLVRRGFRADAIRVIPNGVDLEFFHPDPDTPRFEMPTVLYLGRLKRYKRVDLIIRATASLRERGITARLIVAGRGSAEPSLRRLVDRLRLREHVRFTGFVSEQEKRDLFRRSWVHALTSPKEGWGIANLEAAACGTATVASDSAGLRDSVRDGETGFLVPHGDVAALADRLGDVLSEPALRERLGAGALRFAAYYAWDRAANQTEQHLHEVLERTSVR